MNSFRKAIFLINLMLFLLSSGITQSTSNFSLVEITHGNVAYSTVNPTKVEADSRGGFVEVEVEYSGNCRESYRFEFQFDQDMSNLTAGNKYGFSYQARLLSGQCNDNRNAYIRPLTPLGGSSGMVANTQYSDWVNALSVEGSERRYAKTLGRPKVYATGRQEAAFVPKIHKKGAYSWLTFSISAPSNQPGKSFNYEVLYIYKLSDAVATTSLSCPPPDCSGFPGTVPVWNFQTNRGECWCPEGMVWDKMSNKCMSVK